MTDIEMLKKMHAAVVAQIANEHDPENPDYVRPFLVENLDEVTGRLQELGVDPDKRDKPKRAKKSS